MSLRQKRKPRQMQKAVKTAATEPIKPAVRQAGRRRRRQTFTVVVYRKKRIRRVVLYASDGVFVFTVPARVEINGRVRKRWAIGGTEAYSARVRAADVAKLIDMYAHDAACRRITVLDPVYRAAALQGYKVHSNKLYVELWLSAPLGEPLFSIGDPRERELGTCIKGFTHSFGIWRMVTPPWCASC